MRVDFIENYDVDLLAPADYNPRKLPNDKFLMLQESIKKFGIIKPLIVNGDNNILTAGHQRTRAIKAIGIKKVPVIRINGIKIQDEIKFNLFHNSIETNKSKVKITGHLPLGYSVITPDRIQFKKKRKCNSSFGDRYTYSSIRRMGECCNRSRGKCNFKQRLCCCVKTIKIRLDCLYSKK